MRPRNVSILGTGHFVPSRRVSAEELDRRFGFEAGTLARTLGLVERHYVADETPTQMGAAAAREALARAGLGPDDLDLILCAYTIPEQLIPCNAVLLQQALGPGAAGIPSFDVNATCLGFVAAFDLAATLLDAGQYETALLVSSEVASVGLDWRDPQSALFGDAAAALVLGRTPPGGSSRVVLSRLETHPEGADFCRIRAGGTRCYGTNYTAERRGEFLFEMEGPRLYRLAYRKLPPMLEALFAGSGLRLEDVDLVVPHQATPATLKGMCRRMQFPRARLKSILARHGNCVAATVPLALHEAIAAGELVRGQRCMLLGTAAGFSCGAVVFDY